MLLTSLRFGFATNSSSSHSVVLAENARSIDDILKRYDFGKGEVHFTIYDRFTDLSSLVHFVLLLVVRENPWFQQQVLEKAYRKLGRHRIWNNDSFIAAVNSSTEVTESFRELLRRTHGVLWLQGRIDEADHGTYYDMVDYDSPYWTKLKDIVWPAEKIQTAENLEETFWLLACSIAEKSGENN